MGNTVTSLGFCPPVVRLRQHRLPCPDRDPVTSTANAVIDAEIGTALRT